MVGLGDGDLGSADWAAVRAPLVADPDLIAMRQSTLGCWPEIFSLRISSNRRHSPRFDEYAEI